MTHDSTTYKHDHLLITGIGGPAGIAASKYLKQKGYTVFGTDMRKVKSQADKFFTIPAAGEDAFISTLLEIVHNEDVALVIPTVSEELPVVARYKTEFASLGCHVVIAPLTAVEIANDKLKTAQVLFRHDFPVIRTLPGETPHAEVLGHLGLPLIAKPRISRGGRGVKLYTDSRLLAEEQRPNIVYQEFASGEEYNVNLYLSRQGIVRSCVVLRKTRLKEGIVGNALEVERIQNEAIAQLGIRAAQLIGLNGPVDIDIRLDATDIPRLLEINARLGANSLAASEIMDQLVIEWHQLIQEKENAYD